MTYDISRGKPRRDVTMPRIRCAVHGEETAQAYVGRERYQCWHCATNEYLAILAQHRDDERIFQALYAEHERLVALGPRKCDSATIEHARELRDRYAARVNANRG